MIPDQYILIDDWYFISFQTKTSSWNVILHQTKEFWNK